MPARNTLIVPIVIGVVGVIAANLNLGNVGGNGGGGGDSSCFNLTKLGVIKLPFNPAFLSFDEFDEGGKALVIASFFTVKLDFGNFPPRPIPLQPDLMAKIPLDEDKSFNAATVADAEVLTDQNLDAIPGPPKTVWPNEGIVAPDGVFPFEALVISQGFLSTLFPGRLTAIDLSVTGREEYIISQSIGLGEDSRFYHNSMFYDMDGDGLLDIIAARSGERVFPPPKPPSAGELVWFKNPGKDLDKNIGWEENILVDGLGPDIIVDLFDFDGDGVPEFVTTHFFTGDKISVYGVNEGGKDWSSIAKGESTIRSVDVSTDQGKPFGIKMVDLNGDGRAEILATNHQADNCLFPTDIPGRVYTVIPPVDSKELYDASKWTTRILLDDIYPQPSTPGSRQSRLAPGKALAFYPSKEDEVVGGRPWIVVGGDEAGKVWMFRPKGRKGWSYDISIIFDINDFYGPGATQKDLAPDLPGVSISTIGNPTVRYDRKGRDGKAEIYVPVFEGKDIHVFSFREMSASEDGEEDNTVQCQEDINIECPEGGNGPPLGGPPGGGPPLGVESF